MVRILRALGMIAALMLFGVSGCDQNPKAETTATTTKAQPAPDHRPAQKGSESDTVSFASKLRHCAAS